MSFYRYAFFKLLKKISVGQLVLVEGSQEYTFGQPNATPIRVKITDNRTYKLILTKGILGAGKAYIHQYWDTTNLSDLIHLILKNKAVFRSFDGVVAKINYLKDTILFLLRKNNIIRAKEHIEAHYDLSNEFFSLFLDSSMMYSSAIFSHPQQSLVDASMNKLNVICTKLQISPDDHVLEIGTGWGGFAVFAAKNYGCKVTTTTISKKQYDYTKNLVEQHQLQDKINVLQKDYRLLTGEFDKVVSIEMIEAVGFQYFSDYFSAINNVLKPNGRALVQAITINDKDYHRAKLEVDFIKKYIFPGGCLPSLERIRHHIKNDTTLTELDMEDIGQHYAKTLAEWDKSFNRNQKQIQALGFTTDFINKWQFYFAYCQAGFEAKHISTVQGLWIKER